MVQTIAVLVMAALAVTVADGLSYEAAIAAMALPATVAIAYLLLGSV